MVHAKPREQDQDNIFIEEQSSLHDLELSDKVKSQEIEDNERGLPSAQDDKLHEQEGHEQKSPPITPSLVALQAEDYGGGIALPHYGFRRPAADYFNSNLMTYHFVIADITGENNNVYMYDERQQGKGADALCSLRLRYHLGKMKQYKDAGTTPLLNMSLLDNCVGQNKSQVVMKFACFLSVFFYETVALLYFLPGHSHMLPDRIVGQCKNSIKGLNLYSLGQLADRFNTVKGIRAF